MLSLNLYLQETYTHHTPKANNSSQIDPMQKLCMNMQPLFQPPWHFHRSRSTWKQLQAEHPQNQQKSYGLSHFAPTPSRTTIQQLGLGNVASLKVSMRILGKQFFSRDQTDLMRQDFSQ
jgi:hypothetical protein